MAYDLNSAARLDSDRMQRAFVVQLQPETNVARNRFEGRVEHVDSGRSVHFRTVEEFLVFVANSLAQDGKTQKGADVAKKWE